MIEPGDRVLMRETGEVVTAHLLDARHESLGNDAYVLLERDDGSITAARVGDLEEISTTAPSELPSNIAIGLRLIEGGRCPKPIPFAWTRTKA